MANRDKSQNVGFVYTNIYTLYKKAKEADPQKAVVGLNSDAKVFRADDVAQIKITKFQPQILTPGKLPEGQQAAEAKSPYDDLKANLSRLQDLHSKLRFMINELEDLVNKK